MKVFFSHATRDKPLLREIRSHLPHHIQVWMDERELRVGQHIEGQLWTAIRREVAAVVIFIGPEAVASAWVQKEFNWARQRESELGRLFILPVVLDESSWTEMPVDLQQRRYIKCTDFTEFGVRAFATKLSDELFAYASARSLTPQGLEWAIESGELSRRKERACAIAREIIEGRLEGADQSANLDLLVSALPPLERLRLLCHYEMTVGRFPSKKTPSSHVIVRCQTQVGVHVQHLDWSDSAHDILRRQFELGDAKYLVHPRILKALHSLPAQVRRQIFVNIEIRAIS